MTTDLQSICADLVRRQEETRRYADEVHRITLELMRRSPGPLPMMVYLGSAFAGGALVLGTVVLMRLAGG